MVIEIMNLNEHEGASRELKIRLKGADGIYKTVKTPSFFPTVARKGDTRDLMDAKSQLETTRSVNMPHINGIVIEAHSIPKVLDKHLKLTRQTRLVSREPGDKFTHLYDYTSEYGLVLIIDPNLDRINTSQTYREGFQKLNQQYKMQREGTGRELGKEFFTREILDKLITQTPVDPVSFKNPDFITRTLRLQQKYKSDVFLPPYSAINIRTIEEDLNLNLELYHAADQINKFLFGGEKSLIPVICLHKNMFKVSHNKLHKTSVKSRPKNRIGWDKLIDKFVGLDSDMIILKISNFNTQSRDENYKEVLRFFDRLKSKTTKPIIFFNMNEFAYALMKYGLDIYSARMSRSGIDIPIQPVGERSPYGKYYIPRKMVLVDFEDLEELPCSCPFCEPYGDGSHKDLNPSNWNSLRIRHFVHEKDGELEKLIVEMKKKSLRVALREIYADSENWKNFAEFT